MLWRIWKAEGMSSLSKRALGRVLAAQFQRPGPIKIISPSTASHAPFRLDHLQTQHSRAGGQS